MKPNKTGPFIIMKTLKSSATEFTNLVSKSIREFRDSYTAEVNSIRIDLLRKISEDYGISLDELTSKYIKKYKHIHKDDDFNPSLEAIDTYDDNSEVLLEELMLFKDMPSEGGSDGGSEVVARNKIEQNLLHKIKHNNDIYYVENKKMGNVYDVDLNIVGVYKEGNIELNVEIMNKHRIDRKNKKYGEYVQKFLSDYQQKLEQIY